MAFKVIETIILNKLILSQQTERSKNFYVRYYNTFFENAINILALNKIKYVFTTVGYRNNYNKIFGRSFLLNSKNNYYLKGIINGSMFLIDRQLLRLKKKKIT